MPTAHADTTYHNLAAGNFSQDWTNIGLITTSDNWSGVPSVVGYRGDGLTGGTGTDPQTILGDETTVDVNANQTDPNGFSTGGVTEFHLTNPTIALTGSGTADAPFITIHLDTTGRGNIQISYNLRDLDSSIDDAVQQVALQYRVGASGSFTNVPAGYVADATTGPSQATLVTPVSATLPAAAENQSQVQVRIITSNAAGNDEWVGVDDIVVTSTGGSTPSLAVSVSPSTFNEAAGTGAATGTVTRANDPAGNANPLVVMLASSDTTEAAVPAMVTIPAGEASTTFAVDAVDDAAVDGTQSATITATSAGFVDGTTTVMVSDNDVDLDLISEVQGDVTVLASPLNHSPKNGMSVTVEGVVTNLATNGYYLQEEKADDDGNVHTSEGVFVFTSSAPTVALGQIVRVSGTVAEFVPGGASSGNLPITEITGPMATVQGTIADAGAPGIDVEDLRAAVNITLLDTLPNNQIYNPMNPDDPASGGEFWERIEGMLVEVTTGTVVAPTNNNGEFTVVAPGNAVAGSGYFPSTHNIIIQPADPLYVDPAAPPTIGGGDFNPERIIVDDKGGLVVEPSVSADGDVVNDIVGTVDYSFGAYKIQPVFSLADVVNSDDPADALAPQGANLRIVSFNMENLFDTINEPGRADSPILTAAELNTKIEKLMLAVTGPLALPDIIVCPEIENQTVLQQLATAINQEAGTSYVARTLDAADDRSIETGFIYNSARVSLQSVFNPALLLTPPGNPGSGTTVGDDAHTRSVSVGPNADINLGTAFIADTDNVFEGGPGATFSDSREPVVGVFRFNGRDVLVMGLHLASKGGDNPLFSANQPPIRETEVQRKLQGQYVRQLVDLFLDGDAGRGIPAFANIVVTGDFNDFQFPEQGEVGMDAVTTIQGIGVAPDRFLYNLLNDVAAEERYTFLFDGNSQALDHMLVSPAMLAARVGQDVAHINADFPTALADDETTFRRSADHDPISATFMLVAPNATPVADAGADATVEGCTAVALDGSASVDPDGGPMALAYSWVQTAGPAVTLAGAGTATPSFEAPNVGSSTDVTFELTVSDSAAMSTDTVTITITPSTGPNHDTVGLFSAATFFLRNCNANGPADLSFIYGLAGWTPLVGDWNGDGVETPGVYDPSSGTFFLKNSSGPGDADVTFLYGNGGSGFTPLVGDWNGDGVDTVGLYDPASGTFFLKNTNAAGTADLTFVYGAPNATPVVGDWDGDGDETVGIYQSSNGTFFLKNTNAVGGADVTFVYGTGGTQRPIAGDWDGAGGASVGLYDPTTGTFFLKNTNAAGAADVTFLFGLPAGYTPLAGNWDGF